MTLKEISEKLQNRDIDERRLAVLALKEPPEGAEQKEVIALLIHALQDVSWRVRKTVQDILFEDYPLESYMDNLVGLLHLEDNAGARNSAIEILTKLNRRATRFLIEAFKTTDIDARKFIIDILGQFKDRKALPLMLEALKDEDENVRASAVEHLGTMGEPSVVDALIEILEEGDLWTAYPAADALGTIGDKRAIPALVRALSNKPLREPSLGALGKIGDPESLQYIVPFIDDKSKAVGESAIKAIETLYHKGTNEEFIASELQHLLGERIIHILLEYAWSSKVDVRGSAILLLGLLRDERALDPLLELSTESDFTKDVKKALVFIGRYKPEAILPLFKKDSPYLRRFVCSVAGEVASPIYFDTFAELIADSDGHVRAQSAIGLSNIGDLRAIELIKGLLVDEYIDVQEAAIEALGKFGASVDVAELISNLGSKSPVLRKNSALLIGRLSTHEAVSALGFALKDDNVSVRRAVVTSLSSIRTGDSIKYLILALTDEDSDIRASSALSLGSTEQELVVEPLCLLLNDPDDRVRATAARALGILGSRNAVSSLLKVLFDKNGFVVTTAIDSLGRLGGSETKKALIGMLSSEDKEIRRTAIKSLSKFEGVENSILPFIKDNDWATRVAAVEALGSNPSSRIRAELEKLYDEEDDSAVRKTLEVFINA